MNIQFKPPIRTVTLTSDECIRRFRRETIYLSDGVVPVIGKIVDYKPTNAGTLGAVVRNPLTQRDFLYCIDFRTGRPRFLTKL